MPARFVVIITRDGAPIGPPRELDELPIRFGRHDTNTVRVEDEFVSGTHAVVEEQGGVLRVRDLNSRNGVAVRGPDGFSRLATGGHVALEQCQHEFYLGSAVRVAIVVRTSGGLRSRDTERPVHARREAPRAPSAPLADPQGAVPLMSVAIPGFDMAAAEAPRVVGEMPVLADAYDSLLLPALADPELPPLPQRPVDVRVPVEPQPRAERPPPAAAKRPAPERPRTEPPNDDPAALKTQAFRSLDIEELSFQGFRELAESLVAGRQLRTHGDVARLVKRLNTVIEALATGYVSLEATRQQSLARLGQPARRSALERLNEPAEVARHLLDFEAGSQDTEGELLASLTELARHQSALLDAALLALQDLALELAPDRIAALAEQNGAGRWALGRHKELWQGYCERHHSLTTEPGALLARLARAYRQRRG